MSKVQTRAEYPKPKKMTKKPWYKLSEDTKRRWAKRRNYIKRTVAILILAAGFVRMIYLESDNKIIILGIGVILTVALIEWSLSKD